MVSFFHTGYRNRSIIGREMQVDSRTKTGKDPTGILKCDTMRRSMVRAWRVVKLPWIAIGVLINILDDHKGKILMTVLRSSTCWNVHRLHGFAIEPSGFKSPSVFRAAPFRKLQQESKVKWSFLFLFMKLQQ